MSKRFISLGNKLPEWPNLVPKEPTHDFTRRTSSSGHPSADEAERELKELRAENERLRADTEAVKFAAHMPDDYEFGLPSWINQRLYVGYLERDQAVAAAARWEEHCLKYAEALKEQQEIVERLTAQVKEARENIEELIETIELEGLGAECDNARAWLDKYGKE